MLQNTITSILNTTLNSIEKFSTDTLHMAPITFLTICAFIGSILLCFCCCIPLLCCCRCCLRKRFRHANGNDNRRGLLALMFANLEEFESLTPLIVTPSSSTSSLKQAIKESTNNQQKNIVKGPFKPTKQQLIKAASSTISDSPPLPRRPNTGKTMIVPLTSINNRNLRTTNIQMIASTPDSRITALESATTKSCATIPEDDEFSVEEEDERTNEIDLVSIDRTYISTKPPCPAHRAPPTTGIHQFNPSAAFPEHVPFKENPPLYDPPAPPWEPSAPIPQRRTNLRLNNQQLTGINNNNNNNNTKKYGYPGRDSPGLSSPEASSCGLGSPADTTGSLSDSFLMPSEGDTKSFNGVGGACYNLETGEQRTSGANDNGSSTDTDAHSSKKYQLHRIEEESEQFEEIHRDSTSNISSNHSISNTRQIPRSISQQLEFMKK